MSVTTRGLGGRTGVVLIACVFAFLLTLFVSLSSLFFYFFSASISASTVLSLCTNRNTSLNVL